MKDVSWAVRMTNALTTGRWEGSVTLPRTSAVFCPEAATASPAQTTIAVNKHPWNRDIVFQTFPILHTSKGDLDTFSIA
jgi:hypothetical protein